MSVNQVSTGSYNNSYDSYKAPTAKSSEPKSPATEVGAVYEPSAKEKPATYKPNTNLIAKMQADADARTSELKSLVESLISGQGSAYGKTDSIWSFLASGDFTADPATIAQAKEDVSEDGYWGVEQTSTRIVDFATALTGGDPDKVEEMRDAFIKGYEKATETWGDKLPEISQKTYDAVMAKFDKLAGITTETE